jgi:hypothetical protein
MFQLSRLITLFFSLLVLKDLQHIGSGLTYMPTQLSKPRVVRLQLHLGLVQDVVMARLIEQRDRLLFQVQLIWKRRPVRLHLRLILLNESIFSLPHSSSPLTAFVSKSTVWTWMRRINGSRFSTTLRASSPILRTMVSIYSLKEEASPTAASSTGRPLIDKERLLRRQIHRSSRSSLTAAFTAGLEGDLRRQTQGRAALTDRGVGGHFSCFRASERPFACRRSAAARLARPRRAPVREYPSALGASGGSQSYVFVSPLTALADDPRPLVPA